MFCLFSSAYNQTVNVLSEKYGLEDCSSWLIYNMNAILFTKILKIDTCSKQKSQGCHSVIALSYTVLNLLSLSQNFRWEKNGLFVLLLVFYQGQERLSHLLKQNRVLNRVCSRRLPNLNKAAVTNRGALNLGRSLRHVPEVTMFYREGLGQSQCCILGCLRGWKHGGS